MLKVTGLLPSWDTTKSTSKKGFDKVWTLADKLGNPVNRMSNRVGSESFWPTTLDKESDKAARILRSFCKDGFYEEITIADENAPNSKHKQRVLKKIPAQVIQNAVGLAIFTTMRTGLWISGAGGSGVLVARKEDGEWSPPSGIMLHTAGLGFLVGVDIYDCVLVINNRKALEAFSKVRLTLGSEISAVAGPVGIGGVLEHDGKWKQANKPVFTYLKSRGFYAGVQIDGTIIIERTDENERFYNEKIAVADILAGKVRHVPPETKNLMNVIRAAEGLDFDEDMLNQLGNDPTPGDAIIGSPQQQPPRSPSVANFGVPEPDDPDPFGVLALELAGMEIREAGSRSRPDSSQFEYRPSPTSPLFAQFRRSMDTYATRSNRASVLSTQTKMSDRATQTTGTQTYESPNTSPSLEENASDKRRSGTDSIAAQTIEEEKLEEPASVAEGYTQTVEKAEQKSITTEKAAEKTDDFQEVSLQSEPLAPAISHSDSNFESPEIEKTAETFATPPSIDYTEISLGPYHEGSETAVGSSSHSEADNSSPIENKKLSDVSLDTSFVDEEDAEEDDDEEEADDEDDDEEPVVYGDAVIPVTLLKPQFVQGRGNLVTIPKRVPPALPPRSPARTSIQSKIAMFDQVKSDGVPEKRASTPAPRTKTETPKETAPSRNSDILI